MWTSYILYRFRNSGIEPTVYQGQNEYKSFSHTSPCWWPTSLSCSEPPACCLCLPHLLLPSPSVSVLCLTDSEMPAERSPTSLHDMLNDVGIWMKVTILQSPSLKKHNPWSEKRYSEACWAFWEKDSRHRLVSHGDLPLIETCHSQSLVTHRALSLTEMLVIYRAWPLRDMSLR